MIIVNFKVLDKDWKLRVLKNRKFAKKNGAATLAVTEDWKRRIDVSYRGTDLETIVHELVHAYLAEMGLSSASNIKVEDLEEIYAELMAKRGRELLDLADRLFVYIQSEIEKGE